MPLGSTHDRITLWTLPGVTLAAGILDQRASTALAVGSAYLFSGLMFSGDLDLKSRQYQRWLGLRWIWLPYRQLFKHRSIWSHGPIIGTVVRVIYLGLWGGVLCLMVAGLGVWIRLWHWQPQIWWSQLQLGVRHYADVLLLIGIGLELGSINHTLSDWILSAWKRWRRSAQPRSKPPRSRSGRSS